ncbi:serine/threonine-protein kinase [Streptomyces mayonensis]|uniref:serine/threonine-protein kinase n=1 Tax=Streptomyces mayonensis TaxID=2750816 RepID=UPI001C1E5045|nr:serine/threonine-protein kinase [Streptomyces sp. A108]MBU6535999.1 protein kinase [Streptomyces sp. A108]
MLTGVPDQQADGGSGRVIAGRYLLRDVLGRGGMGIVWRAHDQLLDRQVAAKELHIATEGDEDHRTRMRRALREARAVARVPHPHVVGVHDLVDFEDRLWIVMELVQGPSLAAQLERSGPLTPPHTARLGLQLLDALRAVHLAGTLHRDVKPANVLLRPDGSAVLTDFGIAALDDGELLTSTGQLVGSIEYMAPERAMAQEAGPASDLWSLGATLVTVCGGQSPFRRPAYAATLHAVVYEEPVLPPSLGPLRPVVEALLRKTPGERPGTAEVAAALSAVAEGRTDIAPLPAAGGAPGSAQLSAPPPVPALPPAPTAAPGTGGVAPDAVTAVVQSPGPSPRAGDTRLAPPPTGPSGTALHTAATVHGPAPQAGGPGAGRADGVGRRLAWSLGGPVALVAVVGGGLFLSGVLPFGGDEQGRADDKVVTPAPSASPVASPVTTPEATATSYELVVDAHDGWQPVEDAVVGAGDTVTVTFREGEWTVDRQRMPMTGPGGYDAETDGQLDFAANCKIVPDAPFGTLVTRVADTDDAPALAIGDGKTFKVGGDGLVQLRVNDADVCLDDNNGTITVTVEVTRAP